VWRLFVKILCPGSFVDDDRLLRLMGSPCP
jgi:hypothetical protein